MNEIGNTITSTEEGKEKYDATLKELLANKQFLSRIMKRFVPEFSKFSLEDIENRYIEGEISVSKTSVERNKTNIDGISNEDVTLNEGNIYYDIIFKARYPGEEGAYVGMYVNVEAQNAYYPGYPLEKRGEYYAARRLSAQLKSINRDTDYGVLEPVYSIWLCVGDVPNKEAGTATLYCMEKQDVIGSVERHRSVYGLLNVIILRVNDAVETGDEVLAMLRALCSNLLSKQEKLKALAGYGIRLDDSLREGVKVMCNLSDLVEARGEARGEIKKAKQMSLELLRGGMSHESVAKCARVSVETLKQWEEEALCKV